MKTQAMIENILDEGLDPSYCLVENFSHKHKVPPNSESHFQVTVVSEKFNGLKQVQRHRLVNGLLSEVLKQHVHALTMNLYTPQEWESHPHQGREPPACQN